MDKGPPHRRRIPLRPLALTCDDVAKSCRRFELLLAAVLTTVARPDPLSIYDISLDDIVMSDI